MDAARPCERQAPGGVAGSGVRCRGVAAGSPASVSAALAVGAPELSRFAIGFDRRDRARLHALWDEVIDSEQWSRER